ncbi:MAG: competence/damage-inducible protein A [Nitrospira sp.]|nr:competence/damage-inducible protein A [Nitrospira sp.]
MDNTAAILIIGNEILSGKVTDENSPYLSRELRGLGVDVKRLAVLPDEIEVIAEQIRVWIGQYHLIFTCGGVGPTHDDVTIAGIARGLGKEVIRDSRLLALIQELYPPPMNEAMLKLCEIPEGADLIMAEGLRYPVVAISDIYIFPGIPELLRKKFSLIRERFRSTPFCLKKIFVKSHELEIAHHLATVNTLYPSLGLGSYPVLEHPEYQVMLTMESKDPTYLDQAFLHLLNLLPKDTVVKIE